MSSALRELQRGVRAALLDGAPAAPDVAGDGLTPSARLAVYGHHVLTSLIAALETTFPVVARLVDPRFFRYAADAYVRAHPPTGPCLFEYGATLADFLAAFEPCRALVYLPDVARLEWAMNAALHAPDVPPLTVAGAAALGADALAARALPLHPSVTLLRARWPVDRIWRANQPGGDGAVDLDAGAVALQVWRRDDDVVFRALTPAADALRAALDAGHSLAAALDAARALDPAADLRALLREALEEASIAAC